MKPTRGKSHPTCLAKMRFPVLYLRLHQALESARGRFHIRFWKSVAQCKRPKGNTGLDRKSAHPLLFITRKQGHCTAISCIKSIFHTLVHVSHLGRANSIPNPVLAFACTNLFTCRKTIGCRSGSGRPISQQHEADMGRVASGTLCTTNC